MRAVRIHEFGSTEAVLQYEEVPTPDPQPDELLVKVEAAALNRADLSLRAGHGGVPRERLPIIPGREFAGTVAITGAQVDELHAGERVVAYTLTGGYAEYAVARPREVWKIPDGVSTVTAAALPTAFLTAWLGLLRAARLTGGETLLVQAGSSGVGVAAIQIGRHIGATVITTTSTEEKARRLRELGAHFVIDYTKRPFGEAVLQATHDNKGADVVLEMLGGDVYARSLEILAPNGRLLSLGGAFGSIPSPPPILDQGRTAIQFSITRYLQTHPEEFAELDTILGLVGKGALRVILGGRYPLAEARAAQRALEERNHFGKIVLTMN